MLYRILLLFLIYSNYSLSQNWIDVTDKFIINPDFEDTIFCPPSYSFTNACFGWSQPTLATSDYFNECNNFGTGIVGIPNASIMGFQSSFSGKGYLGFFAFVLSNNRMWSEYVQSQLKENLIKDNYYQFSMRLVRSDGKNFSVSKIGANFSATNLQNYATSAPYLLEPTVVNKSGFLNDTISWITISGVFKAKGDENYITIGWFGGDTITDDAVFLIPPSFDPISGEELYTTETYYAVDSLKLYATEDFDIALNLPNIFSPNESGINDKYIYSNPYVKNVNYKILNRWGNVIFEAFDNSIYWDGLTSNNEKVSDGVYYMVGKYTTIFDDTFSFAQFIHVIN